MRPTAQHRIIRGWGRLGSAALLAGLLMGVAAPPARAATFDVPDGDVAGLIAAINAANGNGQPDTINLAANGTYVVTTGPYAAAGPNGLPSITSQITVNGNGATIERSSAGGTPRFRILHVAGSGDLTLNDVTVQNGHTPDGTGMGD